MGIRKPISACLTAFGFGAVLLSSPAAADDGPKMRAAPVTKGIKGPIKPAEPAKPAETAETAKPVPAKPAETAKPAAPTPAPSAAKPAPSAGAPAASGKPGGGIATPPPAADPGLASLKSGKHEERLDALRLRIESRKKNAPERKRVEAERTRIRWGAVVEQPAVRNELSNHAKRVARLERIRELAIVEGKQPLADRASKALDKENASHEARMAKLAAGGAK